MQRIIVCCSTSWKWNIWQMAFLSHRLDSRQSGPIILRFFWCFVRNRGHSMWTPWAPGLKKKQDRFVARSRDSFGFPGGWSGGSLAPIPKSVYIASNDYFYWFSSQDKGRKDSGDPRCFKLAHKNLVHRILMDKPDLLSQGPLFHPASQSLSLMA